MTTQAATQKSKKATTKTAAVKSGQVHVIQLEGNLGIAQAESLHEQFCHVLSNHEEVMMDAENLAQVDAATIQLFRAFIRDAKKGDIPVKWKAVPEELRQTADMMGMVNGISFDD